MIVYILVLILTIACALAGDVCAKKGTGFVCIVGTLLYACTFPSHVWLYRRANFSTVALFWAPIGMILTIAISCLCYHEPITIRKCLSACLSVAALLVYDCQ